MGGATFNRRVKPGACQFPPGRYHTAPMDEPPPYRITPEIVSLVERIGEGLGRAEAAGMAGDLRLRRINRIRTIQGSWRSSRSCWR